MASPLYFFNELTLVSLPTVYSKYRDYLGFCLEKWPVEEGRLYFSLYAFSFQYVLPTIIISAAHLQIYLKIKNRLPLTIQANSRQDHRERRMQRTGRLLVYIGGIFGLCWLPLNAFNIYADWYNIKMSETELVIYAFCHMFAMSSACGNPFLYGYLNENFRKEFKEIFWFVPSINLNLSYQVRRFFDIFRRSDSAEIQGNIVTTQIAIRLMEPIIEEHATVSNVENRVSTELTTLVR